MEFSVSLAVEPSSLPPSLNLAVWIELALVLRLRVEF